MIILRYCTPTLFLENGSTVWHKKQNVSAIGKARHYIFEKCQVQAPMVPQNVSVHPRRSWKICPRNSANIDSSFWEIMENLSQHTKQKADKFPSNKYPTWSRFITNSLDGSFMLDRSCDLEVRALVLWKQIGYQDASHLLDVSAPPESRCVGGWITGCWVHRPRTIVWTCAAG